MANSWCSLVLVSDKIFRQLAQTTMALDRNSGHSLNSNSIRLTPCFDSIDNHCDGDLIFFHGWLIGVLPSNAEKE